MAVAETVKTKATEYLGYEPKSLTIDLAIEYFKNLRNYPSSYSDTQIEADMTSNLSKIVMAVVELDAKEGAEGEIAHSENGISRSYKGSDYPAAYATVSQFMRVY